MLAVILAGGAGERLHPLTAHRAKPAVRFGGMYRLIDFTLSNAVNSGIRKILVLSQYKSDSLQRHIQCGWNLFSVDLGEFITIMPPQQRINNNWYLGTASAVRQNLYSIEKIAPEYVLILSADHVYKMDYNKMLEHHVSTGADVTVGAIDVPPEQAYRFGIVEMDEQSRITGFIEKPKDLAVLGLSGTPLASMGIYLFSTEALYEILRRDEHEEQEHDFGKHIIPSMLFSHNIHAYPFVDENKKEAEYWRDVGTIDSYWEANMELVAVDPVFNLYDAGWPIRTCQPQYPPAKTVFAGGRDGNRVGMILDSIVSSGCIVSGGRVQNSVLSPGVKVNSYAEVYDSVLMDGVEVGRHAKIRHAIIEKNVKVPQHAVIGYDIGEDRERFPVSKSGVIVVNRAPVASTAARPANGKIRTAGGWRAVHHTRR
jgi:glucose-1-phosphate adenylyltransferase